MGERERDGKETSMGRISTSGRITFVYMRV